MCERAPERPKRYDEQGRELVFSFPPPQPRAYIVNRDRIFDFVKRRRNVVVGRPQPLLPDANVRRYLRARKNAAADFYGDVRDIQTHPDIEVRD
jgi:hypothetical protein